MLSTKEIGLRIKKIRELKKLTQESIADAIQDGVTKDQISRIERGAIANPGLSTINKIAEALGVDVIQLLDEDYLIEDLVDYYSYSKDDAEEYIQQALRIHDSYYSSKLAEGYNTLLQFIIYLPLIDIGELFDVLLRLDGDLFGREDYLVKQIHYLLKKIPQEEKAKSYADYRAEQCSDDHFVRHYNETKIETVTEELLDSHCEYIQIIEAKRHFYKLIHP